MASDMANTVDPARVVHHVRGRVRLQFDRAADVASAADRIRSSLAEHPGFMAAEPHPKSHSVIVSYDAAVMDVDRMLEKGFPAAAVEVLDTGVDAIVKIASGTAVGRGVVHAVGRANTRLDNVTRGVLDLRDVLPLTLFGLSIRRLLQTGFEPVPWYNLLYYSFSTFSILHGQGHGPGQRDIEGLDAVEILRQRYARGEISRRQFRAMLAELQSTVEVVQTEETPEGGETQSVGEGGSAG